MMSIYMMRAEIFDFWTKFYSVKSIVIEVLSVVFLHY